MEMGITAPAGLTDSDRIYTAGHILYGNSRHSHSAPEAEHQNYTSHGSLSLQMEQLQPNCLSEAVMVIPEPRPKLSG